jgi:preprotein translocase subunit SecG
MATWETLLLILLVLNALALGVLVLVQQGKGADIGAAFGSGAANTMFGGRGAGSFLTKVTTWLAIGFFVISFGLAYLAKERAEAMRDVGIPRVTEPVPAPADEPQAPPRDFLDVPDI